MIDPVGAGPEDILAEITGFKRYFFAQGNRNTGKIPPETKAIALEAGLVQANKSFSPDNRADLFGQGSGQAKLLADAEGSTFRFFQKTLLKTASAGNRDAFTISGDAEGQLLKRPVFVGRCTNLGIAIDVGVAEMD